MKTTKLIQSLCAMAVLCGNFAHAQTNTPQPETVPQQQVPPQPEAAPAQPQTNSQAAPAPEQKVYPQDSRRRETRGEEYREGFREGQRQRDYDDDYYYDRGHLPGPYSREHMEREERFERHQDIIQAAVDDWFARCSNAYTDLRNAQRHAGFEARQGRLQEAANILRNAIFDAASAEWDDRRRFSPGPHLVMAAREAKIVLQTADQAMSNMNPDLRKQVSYLINSQMVELITSAYVELDERYSRNMGRRDGCYDCWTSALPKEYFDGVRNLAFKFIALQTDLQEYEAEDLVELQITQAVVQAAKDFISIYTRRRSAYCDAVRQMVDLSNWICEYLHHQDYPSFEMVNETRIRMDEIRRSLDYSHCDCR